MRTTMISLKHRNSVNLQRPSGFFRAFATAQAENLRFYEEAARKALATKGDVFDTRLEIERVRAETEKIRAEVEKVRADLKVDIEKVRSDLKVDIEKIRADVEKNKYDLLTWQIGIMLIGFGCLAGIMAKGFGWLGF